MAPKVCGHIKKEVNSQGRRLDAAGQEMVDIKSSSRSCYLPVRKVRARLATGSADPDMNS